MIDEAGVIQQEVRYITPDGMAQIEIDPGTATLTGDGSPLQNIFVQEVCDGIPPLSHGQIVGCAYDFGPDGATFDPPIVVALRYDPGSISEGVAEEALVIVYYDVAAGQWVPLASTVDTTNNVVSAEVSHFTIFAIHSAAPAPTPVPTLAPTPTETPVSPPAQVPWSLIMGTIAALVGTGVLFYVLRKRM